MYFRASPSTSCLLGELDFKTRESSSPGHDFSWLEEGFAVLFDEENSFSRVLGKVGSSTASNRIKAKF